MKTQRILLSLLVPAILVAPAFANQKLGPGKYISSVSPQFDEQTANQIEKGLDSIQQLTSIDAKPVDSTIHFEVKDNARVDVAEIRNAVKAAVPDVSLSQPKIDTETSGASGMSDTGSQLPSTSSGY